MRKLRRHIMLWVIAITLLATSTVAVFACAYKKGCPGVNGPSIFSCDGGHACYVDICFVCNRKGATTHSNGHGCVNGHPAAACVCWGCGWNCITQGQNGGHPHGYPCNPCNHGCKVCHADAWHCQTCHRAPCICYPAPSTATFSNNWTTGNVTITATNNNGALGHKFFDKDKKLISETKDGLTTSFEVSENGTYYVTPYNAAGTNPNYSKVEISCIDREAPTAIINGNPVIWQAADVTLEIVAEDIASGLAIEPYSFDGGITWQKDNKKVFGENALFDICVIDNLGNVSTVPFEITRIDKEVPTAKINGNPVDWTNQDVTLEIIAEDIASGLATEPYSFDGGITWQADNQKVFGENALFDICVLDNSGNVLTIPFEINRIDKEVPTAIINGNPVIWQSTDVTLEIIAEDIASGLATEPYSFDGGITWQADNKKVFGENALFDICVLDNSGNVLTIPFEINRIDKEAPTAKINGNPVIWQSTDVTLEIIAEDIASGLATEPYSFDGGITWQKDNKKVFGENTLFDICVIDNLGNVLTIPLEINRIDKILPFTSTTAIVPTVDADGNSVLTYEIIDNVELTQDFLLETWNVNDKVGTLHSVLLSYDEVKTRSRSIGTTKYAKFILGTPTNPNLKIGDRVEGTIYVTDISLNTTQIVIPPFYTDNFAPIVTGVTVSNEWHQYVNFATVNSADNETHVVQWGISTINDVNSITQWSNSNYFSFKENGDYFAFAKDINNNVSTGMPFGISHIDKECPVITGVIATSGIDTTKFNFTANATDVGSGIICYGVSTSPYNIQWGAFKRNSFSVNTNGYYYIYAKDAVGNVSAPFLYEIKYIDGEVPTLDYNVPTDWTNKDVTVVFSAKDNLSGVNKITLPDGKKISSNTFSYTFTANGGYTFTVTDNAGNIAGFTITITTIDKQAPKLTHELFVDKGTPFIKIKATDNASGIDYILFPGGKKIKASTVDFEISENGEYKFKARDVAGNVFEYNVLVDTLPLKEEKQLSAKETIKEVVKVVAEAAAKAAPTLAMTGGGGYFLFIWLGADVVVIDDKLRKKHRAWLAPDFTLDLSKINKRTGALHYQIIFSKKWLNKNAGAEVMVTINNINVAKAKITFEPGQNIIEI